ncbi:MAG TPA: DNA topoisomerase IB [Solirubrobacteraceae bacterium]|nr:DNA topoisomerase IB [Solirubrobacteraceae bacterium]
MRLRRADCSVSGLRRLRRGRGFSYRDAAGEPIADERTLERIAALAIPPAWREVWICPDPRGHLQATGIDAAGRKQYLYHELWREQRDRQKFRAMEDFAHVLPRLRTKVQRALEADDEPTRERVGAGATRLLDIGLFRVGGEQYADDETGGFGLATLTREHLRWRGDCAIFDYLGKSGVERVLEVSDRDSVKLLRQLCHRRSGPPELLSYRDGRCWQHLGSDGINDYIKAKAGEEFSAKDFRTWNATAMAAARLAHYEQHPLPRPRSRQRVIRAVIKDVAEMLGNTPAVARRSYVDPRVLDAYLAGTTIEVGIDHGDSLVELGNRRRRELELAVLRLLD